MSEFLGLAYFAEVPVVLVNIQRGGPSTGMPTRTQQSDITACAYAVMVTLSMCFFFPLIRRRLSTLQWSLLT